MIRYPVIVIANRLIFPIWSLFPALGRDENITTTRPEMARNGLSGSLPIESAFGATADALSDGQNRPQLTPFGHPDVAQLAAAESPNTSLRLDRDENNPLCDGSVFMARCRHCA